METIDVRGVAVETLVRGAGPPLVFLHGLDHFAQHQRFFDLLARRFRVVAPRHPGFGRSPRPEWLRSVGDIAYLYLDLIERLALDEVLLVGASFGGWVAMELGIRSTARLGRLVLIDSLGLKFGGRDEAEIADIYALPADEVVRRSFADPANAPDYATMDDAAVEAVARDREAAVLYGWRPYMHNPSLGHWLHRLAVPTLVLWGERDRVVEPGYGERLARAIPGARFATVAAAGHYPPVEQPEAVAQAIEDWR
ncbi:MAG TPA: alpha/beta hydrolase [Stellaceae bacterium]|nr:alpha/beta hydrolase [Stellaceae bacterium]